MYFIKLEAIIKIDLYFWCSNSLQFVKMRVIIVFSLFFELNVDSHNKFRETNTKNLFLYL